MKTPFQFFFRGLWMVALMLTVQQLVAQQETGMVADPTDPAFRSRFQDVSFGDAVAVKVLEDANRSYFLADMTMFPTRFEKITFLNLVFVDDILVNMDPDLSQERMWFMAFSSFPEADILLRFEELKEKTLQANREMTSAEKEAWLEIHDKYQKEEDQ